MYVIAAKPAQWQPHPCKHVSIIRHQSPIQTCTKHTVQEQRRRHKSPRPSGANVPLQGRDPNTRRRRCLVPDLEDAVPRSSGNCHAIFSHTETTHSVVVTRQHAYQTKQTFTTRQISGVAFNGPGQAFVRPLICQFRPGSVFRTMSLSAPQDTLATI